MHYYNNLRGKWIISRLGAYHGATYVAASHTSIHATKHRFDRIAGDWIDHVSAANMYSRPEGAERLDETEYCEFLASEFRNRIGNLRAAPLLRPDCRNTLTSRQACSRFLPDAA